MKKRIVNAEATGRKIREVRTEKHVTVSRLVELLDLNSEQAIYKWQRGDSMPTLDNLIALCDIFDITMDELIQSTEIDTYEL